MQLGTVQFRLLRHSSRVDKSNWCSAGTSAVLSIERRTDRRILPSFGMASLSFILVLISLNEPLDYLRTASLTVSNETIPVCRVLNSVNKHSEISVRTSERSGSLGIGLLSLIRQRSDIVEPSKLKLRTVKDVINFKILIKSEF